MTYSIDSLKIYELRFLLLSEASQPSENHGQAVQSPSSIQYLVPESGSKVTMNSLRIVPRKALPLTRARFLSTSPLARKSAVDAAKDTAKSVDRTVADAAVKGIETAGQCSIRFSCS